MESFKELISHLKLETKALRKIKISVLGDSSTQHLVKALKATGVKSEIDFDIYEADHNEIDIQLLSSNSNVYQHESEFIIIIRSAIKLRKQYLKLESSDQKVFADSIVENYKDYISAISEYSSSKIVIVNFGELPDMVFNNYANKVKSSWLYQSRSLNLRLMDLACESGNVFICDLAALQNHEGLKNCFDPRLYVRADLWTQLNFLPRIANSIQNIINASIGKFKKCLILDLDNTTWGGIIGDDGIEKIQIGSLGLGKAFTELQLWAKNLKNRGIILCVCSKNTESVAKEPFEHHPDMVLSLDDISVFVANWENKADNIRYIQTILNIGFDSMVFLDDNPFERNIVREELPEVLVPELPKDPAEYIPFLQQFNFFETTSFSALDKDRTKQYQSESNRVKHKTKFTSVSDYLKGLEMVAICQPFDQFNVPRIAQLTQRSNQFNLRTIRYTEKDVQSIMNSSRHKTLYISLKDKFGDYGLISVIILEALNTQEIFIDTWIMSCRVLKRDVEKFVLNEIVKLAQKNGFSEVVGQRIPTKKNVLVEDHYKQLGFILKEDKWYLSVDDYQDLEHYLEKQ